MIRLHPITAMDVGIRRESFVAQGFLIHGKKRFSERLNEKRKKKKNRCFLFVFLELTLFIFMPSCDLLDAGQGLQ